MQRLRAPLPVRELGRGGNDFDFITVIIIVVVGGGGVVILVFYAAEDYQERKRIRPANRLDL